MARVNLNDLVFTIPAVETTRRVQSPTSEPVAAFEDHLQRAATGPNGGATAAPVAAKPSPPGANASANSANQPPPATAARADQTDQTDVEATLSTPTQRKPRHGSAGRHDQKSNNHPAGANAMAGRPPATSAAKEEPATQPTPIKPTDTSAAKSDLPRFATEKSSTTRSAHAVALPARQPAAPEQPAPQPRVPTKRALAASKQSTRHGASEPAPAESVAASGDHSTKPQDAAAAAVAAVHATEINRQAEPQRARATSASNHQEGSPPAVARKPKLVRDAAQPVNSKPSAASIKLTSATADLPPATPEVPMDAPLPAAAPPVATHVATTNVVPSAAAPPSPPPAAEPAGSAAPVAGDAHQPSRTNTVPPRGAPRSGANPDGLTSAERMRFIQRVGRAFQRIGETGGQLRLRLSPPELGSLKLDVTVRDGLLTARLEAETDSARNLLLDNLPQLQQRLSEQGIKIERFDVDLMNQSPGGSREHAGSPEERQQRGGQGFAPADSRSQSRTTGGPAPSVSRRGGAGALDVLI